VISGVDFVALPTQDYEKAAEFYGGTLGLPFRKRWGNMPAGEFQAGNLTVALMQMDAFGMEFKPNGAPVAFHVDDFDSAKADLESKGVTFQMDTIDSGVCKQVFFSDPDGNTIGIHNRYAPGG
jgi:catechol 2,3-dioxygenase-like lactoylglutathione lyase family enzyme